MSGEPSVRTSTASTCDPERALHDEVLGAGQDGAMTDVGHLKATCGDCRFATVLQETISVTLNGTPTGLDDNGECRRYPPTITTTPSGATRVSWPIVNNSAWCGEHRWHPGSLEPQPETPER